METLITLGYAAGLFQEDPQVIEAMLRAMKVKPTLVLNELTYWKRAAVVAAVKRLAALDVPKQTD